MDIWALQVILGQAPRLGPAADFRDHLIAASLKLDKPDGPFSLVISGVSGGDEGVRGFLDAYSATLMRMDMPVRSSPGDSLSIWPREAISSFEFGEVGHCPAAGGLVHSLVAIDAIEFGSEVRIEGGVLEGVRKETS